MLEGRSQNFRTNDERMSESMPTRLTLICYVQLWYVLYAYVLFDALLLHTGRGIRGIRVHNGPAFGNGPIYYIIYKARGHFSEDTFAGAKSMVCIGLDSHTSHRPDVQHTEVLVAIFIRSTHEWTKAHILAWIFACLGRILVKWLKA